MKLKSLFLASLAAIAMASCSNEVEGVDNNGGEVAKDAVLNFGIALPGVTTRATDGGTDAGTPQEAKVNDITLVLTYTGNIPTFTKKYPVSAFKIENGKYVLTTKELVAPGTADVTVYVNSNGTTEETIASTGAYDLGAYASIAGDGNFFMTGVQKGLTIAKGVDTNQATVEVNRVAAKLVESTVQADYTFEASATSLNNLNNAKLKIKLTNYAYANLNKKSNALAQTDTYFDANDFWNKFLTNGIEDLWTIFTDKEMTNKTTYCFENNNNSNVPTRIYYKATASVEGVTTGANFYVYKNTLYKDYAALNVVFSGSLESAFGLTDNSTNSDFMTQIGATKYTGGVCYYSANIETAAGGNILRNNSYLLKVTGIKDLGLPEIDTPTPGDPTLLGLDVTVKNWTVNKNDIEL